MGAKDTVFKQTIKYKGFFNFGDFYGFCYGLLKDSGYSIKENSYTEKVSGAGKEIMIEWDAGKKATDYFKNHIKVNWHITSLIDTEIERDGKREATNKGELKLVVEAMLESDYDGNWESKVFYKFLRGFYDKYIIKTTTGDYEDRAADPAKEFIEEVKSFLQISGR